MCNLLTNFFINNINN